MFGNNGRQPQYKIGDRFELKFSGFLCIWTIKRVGNFINNDDGYEYFGELVVSQIQRCIDNNKSFTEYDISKSMFGLQKI